jgi:hypothetical protein
MGSGPPGERGEGGGQPGEPAGGAIGSGRRRQYWRGLPTHERQRLGLAQPPDRTREVDSTVPIDQTGIDPPG